MADHAVVLRFFQDGGMLLPICMIILCTVCTYYRKCVSNFVLLFCGFPPQSEEDEPISFRPLVDAVMVHFLSHFLFHFIFIWELCLIYHYFHFVLIFVRLDSESPILLLMHLFPSISTLLLFWSSIIINHFILTISQTYICSFLSHFRKSLYVKCLKSYSMIHFPVFASRVWYNYFRCAFSNFLIF